MKRKLLGFVMLAATTFVWLPTSSNVSAYSGSKTFNSETAVNTGAAQQPGVQRIRPRRKSVRGYKNYGQYRRTQVGNRRYRLVKRSYWNNGTRLSRWVRIYY